MNQNILLTINICESDKLNEDESSIGALNLKNVYLRKLFILLTNDTIVKVDNF